MPTRVAPATTPGPDTELNPALAGQLQKGVCRGNHDQAARGPRPRPAARGRADHRIDDKGNRVPLDVAEGDVVIFSKYGGTEVKYDGSEYLLLNARDILAVVSR